MQTAEEVLDRLKNGNERFVKGETKHQKILSHQERALMAETQAQGKIRKLSRSG